IENRYEEKTHDPYFDGFDEEALGARDLAVFPSYLVALGKKADADRKLLIEILSSDLPVKVLFRTGDLLDRSPLKGGRHAFGGRSTRLASMAVGLDTAFVVQASASHVYQVSDDIADAVRFDGPALISVYSGNPADFPGLPPYLADAAAMESRAFPTFVFNPTGHELLTRFHVRGNPQAEKAWPVHRFTCEDPDLQTVAEDLAFTLADFLACDRRFSRFFRSVSRKDWDPNMIPASEYIGLNEDEAAGKIPYILMVDAADAVRRVVVDERVFPAARRCAALWRALQEFGGVNSSHARVLLEKDKAVWEEQKRKEIEKIRGEAAPAAEAAAVAGEKKEAVAAAKPPSDEPYIETPRCTTCDECTKLNNRMFAYNENKQAYIKDVNAGTYKDLVEAAERCKVAILHPGKPKNPDEPGLEDLVKRAEKFNKR
ncbi:MAG: hypothetical protein ACYTAF_17295, partial [Planctomycetota bacterium]